MCNIESLTEEECQRHAWHEAGHAVVAVKTGVIPYFVTIYSDDGVGETKILFFEYLSLNPSCIESYEIDQKIQVYSNRAIIAAAGLLAETKWSEEMVMLEYSSCDEAIITDSLEEINNIDSAHMVTDSAIREEARRLVCEYWGAIEAVAQVLMAQTEMTGQEVESVVSNHTGESQ